MQYKWCKLQVLYLQGFWPKEHVEGENFFEKEGEIFGYLTVLSIFVLLIYLQWA